jgi:hypothetical protein
MINRAKDNRIGHLPNVARNILFSAGRSPMLGAWPLACDTTQAIRPGFGAGSRTWQGKRFMAEYAILIYEDEAEWAQATPEWIQQVSKEYQQFGHENGALLRGGSQLQPTMTAQAVRGGTVSTGPMVAATPALSGYYVVEAADLDAAVEIAKQVPSKFGGVEVRPLSAGQG